MEKNNRIIIALVCSSTIFMQFVAIGILPLLPFMSQSLRISSHYMQLAVTVYLTGFMLVQLFVGYFAEHVGRHKIYFMACLFVIFGSIVWTVAMNLSMVLIGTFIVALGIGGMSPINIAIVKSHFKRSQQQQIFSAISICYSVGAIFGPLLTGFTHSLVGWRASLAIFVVFGLAILFFIFYSFDLIKQAKLTEKVGLKTIIVNSRQLIHDKNYVGATLVIAFLTGIYTAFNTAGPFLFTNIGELESHNVGFLMMLLNLAMLFGFICALLIKNKKPEYYMIRLGTIVSSVAIFFLFFLSLSGEFNMYILMIFICIAVFGFGLVQPYSVTLAMSHFGHIAAIAAAFLILVQNGLSIIVSALVAYSHESSQLPLVSIITLCCVISLLASLFIIQKSETKNGQ